MENVFSGVEGNGWLVLYDVFSGKLKKIIMVFFRFILLVGVDKMVLEIVKKKKYGVFIVLKFINIKSNFLKFLIFNLVYVFNMEDFDRSYYDCVKDFDLGLSCYVQRIIMIFLLKFIFLKWDDVEKWIFRGDKIKLMRVKV